MRFLSNIASKAACRALGTGYELAMRRFPSVVRIETTNACNARCIICPHGQIKRPIGRMDDDLFWHIVDQCAEAGCKEVHLHNFGEPLLDRRLEERIRYAKDQGVPKVKIFTNGSLLEEGRARRLIEAGLDEVKISFDGATKEEFERIRTPLQFDEVVRNVKHLVAARDEMQSEMRIKVACCSTTDKHGTMEFLEKIVDGFSFGRIHNWAGDGSANGQGETGKPRIRKPCSRLWRTFTVLANGDVALCCLDYDGQHLLGHVDAGTSIADVWRSAAYEQVRLRHKEARQAETSLCRHCTKSFF
ncbi:MAG: hypothetical protein A2V70_04890 [Planctomycetes bacterium RBG_13_63_9]|nr:MAG: hypothetical protein A2V70_04890 [Planctomycetes bacterium RBG_13_63_9]